MSGEALRDVGEHLDTLLESWGPDLEQDDLGRVTIPGNNNMVAPVQFQWATE
ncbi:hypothetical protein [Amycolatopsis sp. NBC_01480]|uniref:hypothetical protein n=1 Tax=Amycolatopsis sp. NBC_01480 TaxID=2903562 RepID=UPI002E2D4690|nr:hypothetical protein [Amycolatopsis sp. NBC_01480]